MKRKLMNLRLFWLLWICRIVALRMRNGPCRRASHRKRRPPTRSRAPIRTKVTPTGRRTPTPEASSSDSRAYTRTKSACRRFRRSHPAAPIPTFVDSRRWRAPSRADWLADRAVWKRGWPNEPGRWKPNAGAWQKKNGWPKSGRIRTPRKKIQPMRIVSTRRLVFWIAKWRNQWIYS